MDQKVTIDNTAITIKLQRKNQLSLLGVEEDESSQQQIIASAIGAIEAWIQHAEAAVNVCIRLYQCREAFRQSGDEGWQKFCEANFSDLGMSQGHIRSCVSTGRAIVNYMARIGAEGGKEISLLKDMSMSAVKVLGSAPDEIQGGLIERIAQQIEEKGGLAPTAKDVEAQLNEMKVELAQAQGKLSEKDQAIARIVNTLQDREAEMSTLRAKLDESNSRLLAAKEQAVTVVDSDPTSKTLRDEIANLEHQREDIKRDLDRTQSEFQRAKAAFEDVERKNREVRDAARAVDELQASLQTLRSVWSEAFLLKVKRVNPHQYGPMFTKIANELRELAEQLDPTIV
ncbi:hypothetical protein [Hydrogenophaga sp. NFH-34]|uniref:hypothetical protein n=1 Tax=Hydrogenophaga sp. NFH-34 TaxID=2744446 RepID=UPI001F47E996|nr:hypothetical protein [Hydrogenophaga sp. NFH-34]